MKDQKGVTLASLTIYITLIFITLAILATVTSNMRSGIKNSGQEGTEIAEINKFNMYFLQEVKKPQNGIDTIINDIEKNEISFTSGSKFTYKPNKSCIYLNDNIRIAQDIEGCEFSRTEENGKTIITVIIDPENADERVIDYVLNGVTYAQNYENEGNYVTEKNKNITAEMVEFTPLDPSWTDIENVKQALDYLYNN